MTDNPHTTPITASKEQLLDLADRHLTLAEEFADDTTVAHQAAAGIHTNIAQAFLDRARSHH